MSRIIVVYAKKRYGDGIYIRVVLFLTFGKTMKQKYH